MIPPNCVADKLVPSQVKVESLLMSVAVANTATSLLSGEPDAVTLPLAVPVNAPIKVVEFSDFGCPYCQKAAAVLLPYLSSQKDVQIIFYPYPLDATCNDQLERVMHRYSCDWSKGTICAQKQGKLWPFHDKVFKLASETRKLRD